MKITQRLIASALALTEGTRMGNAVEALFTNRYEAAQPSTPQRSYIPAFNRDARFDANSWSRWEMTRKIRYFERNVWLVQAIRDEHVKWTCGPNGLQIQPASANDEWNKSVLEAYHDWCESPVFDSTITMSRVHKQIAGTCHLENDLFILKTSTKLRGQASRPAIQLIESHRCSDPGQAWAFKDDPEMIDGVQMSRQDDGRIAGPKGYWFIDNALADQWAFRPLSQVIHVFQPERIGMFRGITPYHSVMNTLHDLDDLEQMEMQRAKANSEIANIITSPSGELNRDALRSRRFGQAAQQPPVADSKGDAIDQRIQLYRKILGSRTIALKTGEKLDQVGNENPSASTQWYWKYKLGQVCKTAGVPLILIFPELVDGMQGTVVRGIYDDAHETFKGSFFEYAKTSINIYHFWLQWAIYNDPRCIDAPADWKKCHVIPPRAVNVDIGYNSAATLAELAAGVQNFDDIAGRNGTTAEALLLKKGKNIAMIKRIAKQVSTDGIEVQPEEISAPLAQVVQQLALAQQAINSGNDDGEDDEAPPQKKNKNQD